jgi:hypothetical protein
LDVRHAYPQFLKFGEDLRAALGVGAPEARFFTFDNCIRRLLDWVSPLRQRPDDFRTHLCKSRF